jgi:hypothetical protein
LSQGLDKKKFECQKNETNYFLGAVMIQP